MNIYCFLCALCCLLGTIEARNFEQSLNGHGGGHGNRPRVKHFMINFKQFTILRYIFFTKDPDLSLNGHGGGHGNRPRVKSY